MEEVAGSVPRQHSEASVPAQSSCGNCLHDGAPRAQHQEPRNAESLYCDLPRGPPTPENLPGTSVPSLQSVADQGLRPEPERGPSPSAGLPEGVPAAVPRSGSQEPCALPYLEGPTSSPGGSCDQGPDAGGSSPDDTSNSSSVDWDSEERQEGVPGWAQHPVMIPRRLQEASSVDGARRVARPPAGGDAAGQRKEDPCRGSRSAGQRWAKLRGEDGGFSLEWHRLAPGQAASTTPQSGPRSPTPQAPSAQRDTAQATSTQRSTSRATSPPRITHRDTPWTSPAQQDTPRASSTQQDTPWATSPSRVTQWDTPRASATRQSNPQLSCSPRDGQREHPSTSATQQDHPQAAFSTCASWRDNPRTSCAQRDNPRTSCAQRDNPRTSSPNRTTQQDNPKTSCAQRDNPRTSCAQRDNPRASSPNRTTQRDNPKTSCAQRDNPKTACAQWDNPRTSSPNRTTQRDNPRTSSPNRITQRDNPRTSSPNRTTQRDNPRTSCAQRDNPRASSPNRTTQRDNPRTSCAQRDNPRTSSPNRTTQRDNPRTSCAQRDNPRTSSPNRTTQRDNPRTSCAQRDNPRASSPNRTTQQDNPRTSCAQRNNSRASSPNRMTQRDNPRASCAQRDSPKASCSRWDNLRTACTQRNNPHTSSFRRDNPGAPAAQSCTPKDRPGPPSPHRTAPRSNARQSSPHRTNKDIPWASFPLRPTQSDGPRTSSPSRAKQSEVPWASIALRPTQGDRSHSSSPTRPGRDPPTTSSGSTQPNSPARLTPSAHGSGQHSAPRSSPLYPRGAPQMPSEPAQAPCAVCIGHRDAPRASSPPRSLQHDPFPFFPDPRASESDLPHHEPPYMPPAVCIGHRDAPRASSPPRHTQFDPFPFLPDTSDSETQSPQHDPPQLPPPVCIGYRDAPRASSPPRQAPEPSLLFQDLPRASTESLVPSTDSLHEPLRLPTPVCIGHRDAPSFSSPPRQAPEPSLFFQDPPGTSTESLAPSTDSLHGSSLLLPQVCIGHRDAPRASSPPRHPPSDLALLAPSPPPGSSGGSRGSVPPGETRHNLEREEYTVLADLPPPRRLAHREPGPQAQGSNGGRTHSPGRAEVERLFRQERRKSEAPGAFQARDEGRSQRPGQGQSQLLRRQSSPTPSRQAAKLPAKQADPARRSRTQPSRPRSPERRPEGDRRLQGTSPPPRTAARPSEREPRSGGGRAGPREPPAGWQGQGEVPGAQGPRGRPERSWSTQEEGLGPEAQQELGEFSPGAARAPEGMWGGSPGASWEQAEAWEEPPEKPAQRGWGSLQELSGPSQPGSPPEMPWIGPAGSSPPLTSAPGWGAEGACPHPHHPELDWRDLLGLLRAPGHGAWARLPQLDWEGLLQLLQARLPHKDPEGHSGDLAKAPGPKDVPEQEPPRQPEGWAEATVVNGHSPGQQPQSLTQPPSPACTSTQWPKTKVTSGPESSVAADLEHPGPLGGRSDPDRPSSPAPEFQPEEPEESEPSRGQGSLTDQEQADSPDLLNFKKGWMSILDEPGEWKKHWFVLTDSSLKYYRDSTAEEADELDGEIDLRACTDVTEYAVQRNYGFQIHTKDAVYTLSAMTSGIRRNWIEALRKTVRPTSAPDVTKLSDCNKENTLHGYGTQKGSLKAREQRGGPRKVDGQRQALDYVELSPLTQGSPQRARAPARASDRPAKQEELEQDLAQRSEERRKWFEASDSRAPETATGEGPRRGLGAPLTEDQQSRLSEEIEKKWQELEKLPLRENKRVPLTALLTQSREERRGPPGDSHEALEKEVQSLRAQLEAWRLRGEAPQNPPRSQEDAPIPPGYISQEACERSLAQMESSHQQVMEELQRHHERELQRLQQEKEWLLAEETAATASAIEAMKKAYQEELSRELSKTQCLQQGPDGLRKQHQSDVEALKRELQVLSEQYSQKCLEIGALTRQAEEREHTLRCCQQEGQELLRHNQELHSRLSEEIDRLRVFIASQGAGGSGRNQRSSCELEVLLRVKEKELQYLKKEVQCLRDELQTLQQDKRFTSGKYQDVYVELNHIKTRSEREIEQLKEHLRLAMAALREKEAAHSSLAE